MTNGQIAASLAPMAFSGAIIGLAGLWVKARFDGIDERFDGVDGKFKSIGQRLDSMNQRFDDMRDLWRTELRRFEEVMDARLKRLEER
jgi:hypothetical protein